MLGLRKRFLEEAFSPNGTPVKVFDVFVTAVRLPNGPIETITNYQGIIWTSFALFWTTFWFFWTSSPLFWRLLQILTKKHPTKVGCITLQ
ncbi:hypothetical protein [Bacillus suaedaesalsae]|uniref:Uncharacterized protein n=1 Tax=Bacillus suaedaesalsae TaxID=2810349 RepID=A0ABS2DDT5_9BACI|nr:hypothetical protein [Bacillus suaedaesalsae]MBM6616591.1 hypothetical protein [Bacillus suaedaesalsae]